MENILNFFLKVLFTLFYEEILVFFPLVFLFFYSIFIFKNKKDFNFFIKLLIYFFPLSYIFYVYSYLPDYFSSLGQDSLLEAKDPDLGEAVFFLKNFFISLFDLEILKRNRFWLVLISSLFSSIILYLVFNIFCSRKKILINYYNKFFNYFFAFVALFVFGSFFNLAIMSINSGKELKKYENEFKKNFLNYSVSKKNDSGLVVVNYIGESTSALNMEVYGYPFNNTPWLKSKLKDNNLLLFKNIFSTYTHTTPSLVDALSLCTKNCSKFDVSEQKRLALTELAISSNINTFLYSTQGNLGNHNFASKLVLNAEKKFFSAEHKGESLLGNRYVPKIKDNEFFSNNYCKNYEIFKNKKPSLIFLHSYAGHGLYNGYSGHIDDKVKFSYPKYINKKNFLGRDDSNFDLIREYDTAIKYVDGTLKNIVQCTFLNAKAHNKPTIFIYFSDHGESPGSLRGHDSSRATYEMLHVPLIVFFNEKAYDLYKDKFEYLNSIKNNNASLKIINDIILFLFEIDVSSKDNKKIVYNHNSFEGLNTEYLLKRELLNKKKVKVPTFWNKKTSISLNMDKEILETQDVSISLWQLSNYLKTHKLLDKKKIKNLVCQHRANSFILQFKASMSTGCFETDIYYLKDRTISTHNIEIDTNLIFKDFLKSNYQKNTVWMDSKNINNIKNCKYALNWFQKHSTYFESIMLEIPTNSINSINNTDWINCISQIGKLNNIELGYYLNTHLLKKCSKEIKKNAKKSTNCEKLYLQTFQVLDSTKIKSITFDYKVGYEAVKNNDRLKKLKWHIWHVDSIKAFEDLIRRDNTGIILLKNNKHLDNLN